MSHVEILSYLKPEVALCGQGQIEYFRRQPTLQQTHIPKTARSEHDSLNAVMNE